MAKAHGPAIKDGETYESPFETFEIRWFSAEKMPVNPDLACVAPPETRSDFYLFPGSRRCGVKYREGNLETKIRAGSLQAISTELCAGRASAWLKWSAPWGDSPPPPTMDTSPESPWMEVKKRRWIHHFGWHGDDVAPVAPETSLRAEFEVGTASVAAGEWSTLCLECSGGTREDLGSLLRATLVHLEKTGWITAQLPEERARSFPSWLSSLPGAMNT